MQVPQKNIHFAALGIYGEAQVQMVITSNFQNTRVDDWQLRAEAELFNIHFTRWRVAIAGALALIAVVGGIFLYLTHNSMLWWWIVLQTGAYLIQAAICRHYECQSPQPDLSEFSRWVWILTFLTTVTGLLSGALVFWVPADQLGLLLAAIMVSGTFAIGETCASGHEKLVFAAVISQATMTSIALVFHAHLPQAVVICLLFAAIVLCFGRELNRAMLGTILQRLHAQQLLTQLELGQQQLLETQHQKSVLCERQRVMQDMHDGLGSALMSSLVLLERGELAVPQAAALIRECIDDFRLVVDSLEPTSKDISTLIGMLRYRLQYRFENAGIRLCWQMEDLPIMPWLEPSLALDLLRLTQEAITNALKHSNATEIRIAAWHNDNAIELIVQDNGWGFCTTHAKQNGYGLRSMQSRAQRLNAQLTIESTPGAGTRISVRLPIVCIHQDSDIRQPTHVAPSLNI